MRLPGKVAKGDKVKAEDYNALLDFVRSLEVKSGRGYQARRSAGGTVLQVKPGSRGGSGPGGVPSFRKRRMRKEGVGEAALYYVTLEPGYVTNGNPRDAGPIRTYHMPHVAGAGPGGADAPLDAEEAPEIGMTAGDFLYIHTSLDKTGQVEAAPPEVMVVVSNDGNLEGQHYKPDAPEVFGGQTGDHYRKILELWADPEDADKVEARQWYEGDIELSPYVWAADHPNPEGIGPYYEYDLEKGQHAFKSHHHVYGHEVEWLGGTQIDHAFDGENMDPGPLNGGTAAKVYRTREETEAEGATIKAEFRQITQGNDDWRQQIEVDQVGDRIEIKGNAYEKTMIIDKDGLGVKMIEVEDGLVKEMWDRLKAVELTVCKPGPSASDPPVEETLWVVALI